MNDKAEAPKDVVKAVDKTEALKDIVLDLNCFMATLDVTSLDDIELINMLIRSRETVVRVIDRLDSRKFYEPELKDAALPSPITEYDKTEPLSLEEIERGRDD